MLGPGIMFGSSPLALGYSLYARARATTHRPLTYIALGLAVLACLFIGWGIVAITIDSLRPKA
jgi:hypothetical protein